MIPWINGDPLDRSNQKRGYLPPTPEKGNSMVCNERAEERRTKAIDVKRIRGRLRYTQRQFAGYFGLSVATLRHWERGNRQPAGPALVLLHVIAENPRVVLQAVRKLRTGTGSVVSRLKPPRSFRAPPGMMAHYWRGD